MLSDLSKPSSNACSSFSALNSRKKCILTRRKRALLLHFGTAGGVRAAALEDLQRAPGVSATVAQTVYDFYHPGG